MSATVGTRSGGWDALLSPRAVAVVGASEERFYARNAVQRLQRLARPIPFHLVNPNRREAFGIPCVADIASVEEPVDAAILVVRAERVASALVECAAAGVRAAIVVAAGAVDVTTLRDVAAAGEMVVLGPSSLGILNPSGGVELFAGAEYGRPLPGEIGFVSQSGGLLQGAIGEATQRGLGFTQLIAVGSGTCVPPEEAIELFVQDRDTEIVCAVVEELREPTRFAAAALAAASAGKPLVVLKIGRSCAGARLAVTHTGAITGSDEYHDALLADLGALRVQSLEELFDTAMLLATTRHPRRPIRSTAIVSLSGGVAGAAADMLERTPVDVPAPAAARYSNPLEFGRQLQADRPEAWSDVLDALAEDSGIDALLVFDLGFDGDKASSLAAWRERTGKPVALSENSPAAASRTNAAAAALNELRLAAPLGPASAARALDGYARYVDTLAPRAARTGADARLRRPLPIAGDGTLTDVAARELLRALGIPVPAEVHVVTVDAAVAAAACIGPRVVVKSAAAVEHRTELGLVRLGLGSADDIAAAAADLLEHGPVIVQEEVEGLELFVGADNCLGHLPLVTISRGGTLVELEPDRVRAVGPIGAARAHELVDRLAVAPVFRGYRGRPALDLDAACDVVVRLAGFAFDAWEDVAVVEINPLVCRANGKGAVAVDALIELRERS